MIPLADLDALRTISHRAQMAYALSCIEAAVRAYDLRGPKYEEWLERAWRRTSAPKTAWRDAPWPRNFAETDELLDPPVGGWGSGVSDVLRKLFELARNTCEDILEGHGAAEPVRALATELARHGIEPPPIARFLRSPSTEMGGLGRSVPPSFFRSGVEREEFPAHLVHGLESEDPLRRRESAHAAGNLGIGSAALLNALTEALGDFDPETRRLAEAAVVSLGSPADLQALQRRKKEEERFRRVREGLDSLDVAVRVAAAGEASWIIRTDRAFAGVIRRMAREDPDAHVRLTSLATLESCATYLGTDVLPDVLASFSDESEENRFSAARMFGRLRNPNVHALVHAASEHLRDARFMEAATRALEGVGGGVADSLARIALRANDRELDAIAALLKPSHGLCSATVWRLSSWIASETTDTTRAEAFCARLESLV